MTATAIGRDRRGGQIETRRCTPTAVAARVGYYSP
jgi:hypothetical protein